MVLGIVSAVLMFIPYLGLYLYAAPLTGIVLSALGKKSVYSKGKATVGLVLSIIAAILAFVFGVIYIVNGVMQVNTLIY